MHEFGSVLYGFIFRVIFVCTCFSYTQIGEFASSTEESREAFKGPWESGNGCIERICRMQDPAVSWSFFIAFFFFTAIAKNRWMSSTESGSWISNDSWCLAFGKERNILTLFFLVTSEVYDATGLNIQETISKYSWHEAEKTCVRLAWYLWCSLKELVI